MSEVTQRNRRPPSVSVTGVHESKPSHAPDPPRRIGLSRRRLLAGFGSLGMAALAAACGQTQVVECIVIRRVTVERTIVVERPVVVTRVITVPVSAPERPALTAVPEPPAAAQAPPISLEAGLTADGTSLDRWRDPLDRFASLRPNVTVRAEPLAGRSRGAAVPRRARGRRPPAGRLGWAAGRRTGRTDHRGRADARAGCADRRPRLRRATGRARPGSAIGSSACPSPDSLLMFMSTRPRSSAPASRRRAPRTTRFSSPRGG